LAHPEDFSPSLEMTGGVFACRNALNEIAQLMINAAITHFVGQAFRLVASMAGWKACPTLQGSQQEERMAY
jgi:hypothetical protein